MRTDLHNFGSQNEKSWKKVYTYTGDSGLVSAKKWDRTKSDGKVLGYIDLY